MIEREFDIIVVGGGLSGICAAIGAARCGVRVALVHDRPLLGGNASGELRIHIAGADCSGGATGRYVRETGVIDELRLENLRHNPADSPDVRSLIFRQFVEAEPNIELFMNTRVRAVVKKGETTIAGVQADQMTTEKQFFFKAGAFIDCTGDGTLAAQAGAFFRIGREGKDEFNESLAPGIRDSKVLPSCVEFYLKDMGKPTPFTPPPGAHRFETDEDLPFRGTNLDDWKFGNLCGGFWWLSTGGDRSTIEDNEETYRNLLSILLGVWDHMKNRGDHGAANYALDWISPIPGKRESRRIEGDYWLTQRDILEARVFDDRVAYGGWPIDLHPPEGIFSKDPPNQSIPLARPYTIPLRCLYSQNIENLLFAGRNASLSHVALGSVRVMATCALMGQAAGVAAAVAVKNNLSPRQVRLIKTHEVQQTLLKQGVYIPFCKNEDSEDLARTAAVTASSQGELTVPVTIEDRTDFAEPLFQLFPVSDSRLDSVDILVESEAGAELTARLRKAEDIWDFSSRTDLATCRTAVPGQGIHWITFNFNLQNLQPGLYWLVIEGGREVKWCGTFNAPVGTVRGEWKPKPSSIPDPGPFYQTRRGTYIFRLNPVSRPYGPENILNGVNRPERWTNLWVSQPLQGREEFLKFSWPNPVQIARIDLTFDGQSDANVIWPPPLGVFGREILPTLVKRYDVQVRQNDSWLTVLAEDNNYRQHRIHRVGPYTADGLNIRFWETNGVPEIRIFNIRVYHARG